MTFFKPEIDLEIYNALAEERDNLRELNKQLLRELNKLSNREYYYQKLAFQLLKIPFPW